MARPDSKVPCPYECGADAWDIETTLDGRRVVHFVWCGTKRNHIVAVDPGPSLWRRMLAWAWGVK